MLTPVWGFKSQVETLDLHRLHESIINWETTFSSRQSGKTTILMYQIIGDLAVGNSDVVFLFIPNFRSISFVRKMFLDCLVGQGLTVLAGWSSKEEMVILNQDKAKKKLKFITTKEQKIGWRNYSEFELDC